MVKRLIYTLLCASIFISNVAFADSWRAYMSPGPVGQPHQQISGNCDRCHLVFKGVPDEKCLDCHASIEARLTKNKGFHASQKEKLCVSCHVDHKGKSHPMTKEEAKKAFDHSLTVFPLVGSHEKLQCDQCHNKPLHQMKDSCQGCHEDPHKGDFGSSCQACHNSKGWRLNLKNLENHQVRMDGGHSNLECKNCHAQGKNLQKKVACQSCHERAHGGTKQACDDCHNVAAFKPAKFDHTLCPCAFPGKHKEVSCLNCHAEFKFTNTPTLCSGCHQKDLTHDPLGECSLCHSPLSWKKNRFNHNRQSRFKLENDHLEVDCFRCHTQKRRGKRIFKSAPKDCYGCHKEDGIEAHGDFGDCSKCHTTEGFEKSTFDHASTGFVLDGQHGKIECQDCHAEKTKGYPKLKSTSIPTGFGGFAAKVFLANHTTASSAASAAQTPQPACAHCHKSPHKQTASNDCNSCHTTKVWKPSTFDLGRHEKTSFPLKGAHQKTKCQLCHIKVELKGQPKICAGCHFDIHQGKFGNTCNQCHDEMAFKPVPNFDHAKTGFPLVGPHSAVNCLKCHGEGGKEDLTKRKNASACVTCHEPGHGRELGANCEVCHSPADGRFIDAKKAARFDHATTGFSIERRHRLLECKRCHPAPVSGKDRLPPTGRCSTCHIDPHKGGNTGDCAMCHQPDRWRLIRFDHDQSGWALRGRHMVTPCASCHTNQRWFGLPTDCFDCHALDAARGATVLPAVHAFGRLNCADCHFNGFSWQMR